MTHVPKKITEIMAWICTEPDGGDGIPAINLDGMVMPLIGADAERIASFEPYAQAVASEKGYPVRLVRFTGMEVVKELKA